MSQNLPPDFVEQFDAMRRQLEALQADPRVSEAQARDAYEKKLRDKSRFQGVGDPIPNPMLGRPPVKFPAWRYHATEPPALVQNAAQEAALGDGWADSPAHLVAPEPVKRGPGRPKSEVA